MSRFTEQQSAAIHGTGNLLLVAGAGTGKTHTLIARCLRLIVDERVSVENILMVTFTEAAAAEMRGRLRTELLKLQAREPDNEWLAQQLALLDTAHISTLHSFCLQLAREHFHELGLDPQFNILDETQTRPLQRETLDALLETHYTGKGETSVAARELIHSMGRGSDGVIRKLILKLHAFSQSLPDPSAWLAEQTRRFEQTQPDEWRRHFALGVSTLRDDWTERLRETRTQTAALQLSHDALEHLAATPDFTQARAAIRSIAAADIDENWPRGTKGKHRTPLKSFFEEAEFFNALIPDGDTDPLSQDWTWARGPMLALLSLVKEFANDFAVRKREFGGVDFTDLEQCALRLLRDKTIAAFWQQRLAHIFVDEYQDINAVQDAILSALSRPEDQGNRFLVGDVKQSIYRFRLANPKIFQAYQARWRGASGGLALSLTENFRSRQAILDFVNPLFSVLMRPDVGGVNYEPLQFGSPSTRSGLANSSPRVEFHLIAKTDPATASEEDSDASDENPPGNTQPDLVAVEREARLIARRFQELHDSKHQVWDKELNGFRDVKWGDMAVLMRSPSGRAEAFAQEFSRAGIPLNAARDGFFDSLEVSDLLNLLRLLDNPLQDVPLAAVLRSPLVGLTMDELVEVRLADQRELLWTALVSVQARSENISIELSEKVAAFLDQFHRWRILARQTSLSQTLEAALNETHYESLLLAGARGADRLTNVRRLLDLARKFDPFQRQGLHRFLRFVRLQEDEELDLEPAAATSTDAARLISIHRSKGLEFPIVALACAGTNFNQQDLGGAVLLDEQLGLCPKITPPGKEQSYASLPHKLACKNERRELRAEELRLLYVAMTRARDALLLVGTTNKLKNDATWVAADPTPVDAKAILAARSHLDWLRLWLPNITTAADWSSDHHGQNSLLTWQIVSDNDAVFKIGSPTDASSDTTLNRPTPPADAHLDQLRARLEWKYPHTAATREPAKTSVTALRKRVADETDDEAQKVFRTTDQILAPKPNSRSGKLSAAESGIAHHIFQQHVAIERTATELDLRNEAEALLDAGLLTEPQRDALDFGDLAAFWQSEVGVVLRKARPETVNREMEFTARLNSADLKILSALAQQTATYHDDFVVIQGQVDLAVLLPTEIWLLDFKTDSVDESQLAEKAKQHTPQLEVYACALEKIYRRPVTRCWLHFLRARKTIEL